MAKGRNYALAVANLEDKLRYSSANLLFLVHIWATANQIALFWNVKNGVLRKRLHGILAQSEPEMFLEPRLGGEPGMLFIATRMTTQLPLQCSLLTIA